MTTIIVQRYANREYRLTCQSVIGGKKKGGDKYAEVQAERYAKAVHSTYVLGKNLDEGLTADYSDGSSRLSAFGEVEARQALRALDIINEFQTSKKSTVKGGWGHLSRPTKFTRNARHRLLEAGAIVDQFCGLNAYEITCTLPGSTVESMRLLAENTGWIMNELTQIMRRAKCKYWFYVWELQKRGALHLHLLVADPEKNLSSLAKRLESRWWELLKSISSRTGQDAFARKTGGTWQNSPMRWQSHIAPIQKSVAAYFSKYAGKGSCNSSPDFKSPRVFCPSRWWGCSKEIKEQIKIQRQKFTLNVSTSTANKISEFLQTWLNTKERLTAYQYDFQLGNTIHGTPLGQGKVWVNYYTDAGFAQLQSYETIMWDAVLAIACEAGEYDYPTQTWTDADMACRHPLDADMEQRRHAISALGMQTCTLSPSPHSQPSPVSRKLSNARGTQAEPTLALRARLIQFLAGGDGGDSSKSADDIQPPEYIQGELFNKNYYRSIDRLE